MYIPHAFSISKYFSFNIFIQSFFHAEKNSWGTSTSRWNLRIIIIIRQIVNLNEIKFLIVVLEMDFCTMTDVDIIQQDFPITKLAFAIIFCPINFLLFIKRDNPK